MNSKQKLRTRIILIALLAAAGGLGSSLYWTQLVRGSIYAERADKQYEKPQIERFDRGTIFFSAKDGTKAAAATVASGYLIYLNPKQIGDASAAYEALSHYLELDKEEFMRKAGKKDDPYEELLHRVSEANAESIKDLGIKGVGVTEESWRSYPGGELAAHALGLIGENRDGITEGRYGLERSYEHILSRSQSSGAGNLFADLFGDIGGGEDAKQAGTGPGSVITTVEPTVVKYVEKILKQASAQWKPDEIGAIVMDPNTGEIAAMVSLPSYDPNNIAHIKDAKIFSNPLVENVYEMGSILKPLTVAVGLDSGAITPNSTYDDTGTMTLNTKKISNFDGVARGTIKIQEILSQSLNVGAATVALKVGRADFVKYFTQFGIGEKSGIDQPNEAKGLIRNLENGQDIEIATAAYGQGIALSPIAITRSLAILANGGTIVRPHLVKQIDYIDGTSKEINPAPGKPVLKKETTENVTRMLVQVVDTALHKGELKMEHYSVAAKTGTAQIPNPNKKGYYEDRYLHSFFGYFPAYKPRYIVFIYQVNPKGAQFASETLAVPFSEISKFLIDYYNVPPDR
jgi:stage V sporulation protein D (sporulation-specific penicillin-binding protein)